MKIAILGTRGIPNYYGGFEQCAEYLAVGLVKRGFEVIVYNSHNHPYQEKVWNGINIIHCYDPEYKLGTAGQFIYDLNCIISLHNLFYIQSHRRNYLLANHRIFIYQTFRYTQNSNLSLSCIRNYSAFKILRRSRNRC